MPFSLRTAAANLACLIATTLLAQTPQPALQVSIASGQTTFHIGERIPLDLSFTAAEAKRFQMSTASYDRSGRLQDETYTVTPGSGWADPLESYFANGIFMGGGLSSIKVLSPEPEVLHFDLNEWVRFDQPGTYRVTVRSGRVADIQRSANHDPLTVTSNTIDLHIVAASPEWKAEKLREIVKVLDAPQKKPDDPANLEAAADLRYLSSPAAVRELVARMPKLESTAMFGLLGMPRSLTDVAIGALKEKIEDPQTAVSATAAQTLIHLQMPDGLTPETYQREYVRMSDSVWQRILAVLPGKDAKVRGLTAEVLFNIGHVAPSAEAQAQIGAGLAAGFSTMSEDQQAQELAGRWDMLRPYMNKAALESIARLPLKDPNSNETQSYNRRGLKAAALRRWYQLDPEGATREIEAQIGSDRPALAASSLSFLHGQSFHQFEGQWAQAFVRTDEPNLVEMMVRFGVGSAAAQMTNYLDPRVGKLACAQQSAALGYLVKFDPASARPLLERALAARDDKDWACYRTLFTDVSRLAFGKPLLEAAIRSLDDPDLHVADEAVNYLTSYGDETAREPLWQRYIAWTGQWAGRADLLLLRGNSGIEGWDDVNLGMHLGGALIASQGWVADSALISKVQERCVGEQVCQQLKQDAAEAVAPFHVMIIGFLDDPRFRIGSYSCPSFELFDAKIAEYPKGSKFVLDVGTSPSEDLTLMVDQMLKVFAAHGMSVEQTR